MKAIKGIQRTFLVMLALFFGAAICAGPSPVLARDIKVPTKESAEIGIPSSVADERDQIFMMLALAVVYKDWQENANPGTSRGYNIGSVLVNKSNNAVYWARNCVNCKNDGTQHGEVRLMTGYQEATHTFSLKGFTIYTSLEPCAMCGGMMCMQQLTRTVFAQKDPDYGDGIQRLALDSTALGAPPKGYKPYPRTLPSVPSTLPFYTSINRAYQDWLRSGNTRSITQFLASPTAKQLYAAQTKQFLNYKVVYPDNAAAYDNALKFYNDVPVCTTGKCCDVPENVVVELPVGQHESTGAVAPIH